MPTLVALGYPDQTTASAAADEARRLAPSSGLEPDAIAVVRRGGDGSYQVTTTHHAVPGRATWGMFWEPLFGVLFFVPVLGMDVGPGLAPLLGTVTRCDLDRHFQAELRVLVQPGTSALFLVAGDTTTAETTVDALGRFGGAVLKSLFRDERMRELQEALHGQPARVDR